MKLNVIQDTSIEFKPIQLELKIETIQEARLLFHIINNMRIRDLIKADISYTFSSIKYCDDIVPTLPIGPALMRRLIEDQGFKV